jgi:2'-5' RNA ligase
VFHQHVTLAYPRGANPARVGVCIQAASLLKSPPFRVAAFGRYSSWCSETGSAYRLERRYVLA